MQDLDDFLNSDGDTLPRTHMTIRRLPDHQSRQLEGEITEEQAFHHDVTVPRICPGSDQIFAKYQGLDPGHDLLTTPR